MDCIKNNWPGYDWHCTMDLSLIFYHIALTRQNCWLIYPQWLVLKTDYFPLDTAYTVNTFAKVLNFARQANQYLTRLLSGTKLWNMEEISSQNRSIENRQFVWSLQLVARGQNEYFQKWKCGTKHIPVQYLQFQ